MKKFSIKRPIAVVIATAMLFSCVFCGTASAAEGQVTYKYVVTSEPAAAFEGTLTYPADTLAVDSVAVFNETGTYAVSNDTILFNFTSESDIDFSDGLAVVTVVFTVTGDYEKNDVNTTLCEFYSTDMAKGKENIPYKYAHVFDDEVFLSGYADIDNPENDSIDPTGPEVNQELIDAINALWEKYDEAVNTIFAGSNDYTDESLQRVWDALYEAEDILNKSTDELTIEEVLAQIEALQNALDALEERDTTPESTSSEPTSSSVSDETTDPTEQPTSSSVSDETTDPTEEPTTSSVSDETTDPTEQPTSSSVSDETTDPTEEPTTSSVSDETTNPTEKTTATDNPLADALNELSEKISEAESVIAQGSRDYTIESIQRVWDAVHNAKELLNSTDEVTVEEVSAQIEAIKNALDALEKRDTNPENPTTQPTSNSEPTTAPTTGKTEPTESANPTTAPTTGKTEPTETEPSTTVTTEPTEPSTVIAIIPEYRFGPDEPKAGTFSLLQVKNTKTAKTSVTLGYKKPSGAKKFIIYGAKCGKRYKRLAATTKKSVKIKNLKKGKYYKFLVVALNSKNRVVAISKAIHVATKGGKYGNPNKVKITNAKKAKKIKTGKSVTLKTKVTAAKGVKFKTHRKIAFESSNTKVATVTKNGKIKAKKKGTCYIYAYAQNGVMAKVKVTVKK